MVESTQNETPATSLSPERSTTLWFNDGNLVLRTKTKQYRVHQSILGTHSSVFRDMFGVPQPEIQQTIDGCPVVDVTDSAQDWDALLAVVYGLQTMHYMVEPTFAIIRFDILRAALVLGTKYDFTQHKAIALDQLETLFPQTLTEWDDTERLRMRYSEWKLDLLELVISFGRDTMLPSAYYLCIAQVYMGDILAEYRQQRDRPIPFASLDKLLQSQQLVMDVFHGKVLRWCWDGSLPTTDCLSEQICSRSLFSRFNKVIRSLYHMQNFLEPFNTGPCGAIDLCPRCKTAAARGHSKGRQRAWQELPETFGLDSWENSSPSNSE